jgi:hypothetical protein
MRLGAALHIQPVFTLECTYPRLLHRVSKFVSSAT